MFVVELFELFVDLFVVVANMSSRVERRAQRHAHALHVLMNVLGFNATDGIVLALVEYCGAGRLDLGMILCMSSDELTTLSYPNSLFHTDTTQPANIPVPYQHTNRLMALRFFHAHRHKIGKQLAYDDWWHVTHTEFVAVCNDPFKKQFNLDIGLSVTDPTPTSQRSNSQFNIELDSTDFASTQSTCVSVASDPSAFPSLADDSDYDLWIEEFRAVGRLQGLQDLFCATYIPIGTNAIELFAAQQQSLYSVLCSKVLTPVGRTIIKEFDGTSDAQAILLALEDYHHPRFTQNKVEDKVESYFTKSYPISKSSLQDCGTRKVEDKVENHSTMSYECDESSTAECVHGDSYHAYNAREDREWMGPKTKMVHTVSTCLLYTSPSPRDS